MNSVRVVLLVVGLSQCQEQGRTPHDDLEHMNYKNHVAKYGDAAQRGPAWYSMDSQEYKSSKVEDSGSETSTRVYRTCTPCPHDMLKKYTNKGIKWICAGYQRARRTFKSECMMRFRNCQDGTKISEVKQNEMIGSVEEFSHGAVVNGADNHFHCFWRKWHRKCPRCPEDMAKKWRDPSMKWICGAYQRARRTFKSKCMMIYRNCQDGTMFVEIHQGRCQNDSENDPQPHGDHFFYEYRVFLSDDSSDQSKSASSEQASGADTDY
ncbi:unnamed protein product [Parnassius apollo]|uniref:(apollo) hypothetical protein n=1 Tax=Parnassius apollo TaxID=110799 RepID=A0A8S3Y941_PARAO|nr:unnamed protein product [Parnassius apollo]